MRLHIRRQGRDRLKVYTRKQERESCEEQKTTIAPDAVSARSRRRMGKQRSSGRDYRWTGFWQAEENEQTEEYGPDTVYAKQDGIADRWDEHTCQQWGNCHPQIIRPVDESVRLGLALLWKEVGEYGI